MSTTSLAENNLTLYRVRPRFSLTTEQPSEVILQRLRSALTQADSPCRGQLHQEYATLFLPAEEQHYWSPQLTLSFETTEEKGCLIRGLYGPRPEVWTMFVFFYALIGLAALVVAIIGSSNLSLDKSGAVLWLLPVLVLVFLSLYLTAYFGKRLGQEQLITLHCFLERSTGLAVTPKG